SMLKSHKLISQVHVVGNRRKHIAALITVNREQALNVDAKVRRKVDELVNQVNDRLKEHEYIKSYVILAKDFSIEEGEITPSFKIRKKVVEEKYKSEIESLYASTPG